MKLQRRTFDDTLYTKYREAFPLPDQLADTNVFIDVLLTPNDHPADIETLVWLLSQSHVAAVTVYYSNKIVNDIAIMLLDKFREEMEKNLFTVLEDNTRKGIIFGMLHPGLVFLKS